MDGFELNRIPDYVLAQSLRCVGRVPDEEGAARRCILAAGHSGFHMLERPMYFQQEPPFHEPTIANLATLRKGGMGGPGARECAVCGPRPDSEPLFAPSSNGEPKRWYCARHSDDFFRAQAERRWWQFWRDR